MKHVAFLREACEFSTKQLFIGNEQQDRAASGDEQTCFLFLLEKTGANGGCPRHFAPGTGWVVSTGVLHGSMNQYGEGIVGQILS